MEQGMQYGGLEDDNYNELITSLHTARQKVNFVTESSKALHTNIEHCNLINSDYVNCKAYLNNLITKCEAEENQEKKIKTVQGTIEKLEQKLHLLVTQNTNTQKQLIEQIMINTDDLKNLQNYVLDELLLKRWRREQQLNGNGVPMKSDLNIIQKWCEQLVDLIWISRQQVINLRCMNNKTMVEYRLPQLDDILDEIAKKVSSLLTKMVQSTFIIENQPPQVLKKNTKFSAKARLLVGGQLNVYMTPPIVKVSIITEDQAKLFLMNQKVGRRMHSVTCGDILNNSSTMEYDTKKRELSLHFRNMQISGIKRTEKKGNVTVMDEKLCLLFESTIRGHDELDFHVAALSLPVVVIVHANQEAQSWATVTWDNAFSLPDREVFKVPETVTWGQLAETLRSKFTSAIGGELTDKNLHFLAEKFFHTSLPINTMELNAMSVSWTQFCKDALPERNFTFWEWFYMVVKVTRDYLWQLWCDGLIMGFIQKKQAEEMLSKCPPGTFLLRFSDSELGGITIAWTGGNNATCSIEPFTSKDLSTRSLANRILDIYHLKYLYPNVPKEEFSKYSCTADECKPRKDGYERTFLITAVPSLNQFHTPRLMSQDSFDCLYPGPVSWGQWSVPSQPEDIYMFDGSSESWIDNADLDLL